MYSGCYKESRSFFLIWNLPYKKKTSLGDVYENSQLQQEDIP